MPHDFITSFLQRLTLPIPCISPWCMPLSFTLTTSVECEMTERWVILISSLLPTWFSGAAGVPESSVGARDASCPHPFQFQPHRVRHDRNHWWSGGRRNHHSHTGMSDVGLAYGLSVAVWYDKNFNSLTDEETTTVTRVCPMQVLHMDWMLLSAMVKIINNFMKKLQLHVLCMFCLCNEHRLMIMMVMIYTQKSKKSKFKQSVVFLSRLW